MKVNIGHGRTIPLAGNHRCDITIHEGKVFDKVYYDIWHNDSTMAKYHNSARFFRWGLLFGRNKEVTYNLVRNKWFKVMNDINDKIKLLGIDDEISIRKGNSKC